MLLFDARLYDLVDFDWDHTVALIPTYNGRSLMFPQNWHCSHIEAKNPTS